MRLHNDEAAFEECLKYRGHSCLSEVQILILLHGFVERGILAGAVYYIRVKKIHPLGFPLLQLLGFPLLHNSERLKSFLSCNCSLLPSPFKKKQQQQPSAMRALSSTQYSEQHSTTVGQDSLQDAFHLKQLMILLHNTTIITYPGPLLLRTQQAYTCQQL